jgi:WD40 repeat protein
MAEPPHIFISYARSDGKDFAEELYHCLADKHGFSVWLDIEQIEAGGEGWWTQIEQTIKSIKYLVLVMTPGAERSNNVRKEWRLARQEGVCVLPIITSLGLNSDLLPRWIRKQHFLDLTIPQQRTQLIRTLESPYRVPRVPFMCDSPPPEFVNRISEFDALLNLLLDQDRQEPAAITAALVSFGGYGKTVLASALCMNNDIRDAFGDGILWVKLGDTIADQDVIGRINDLIYLVSGERPGFTSISSAKTRLVELLADREMLIVIDDAWHKAHVDPFLEGGPNCARLITARRQQALPADTRLVPVGSMNLDESFKLLGWNLKDANSNRGALEGLADRLGRWPQLLRMVNSVLRKRIERKASLVDALEFVIKNLNDIGLNAFDEDNEKDHTRAVGLTLNLSLNHLDEEKRDRFFELAIFPENEDIPLTAVHKLWNGYTLTRADKLCGELFDLSLLRAYNLKTKAIELHDVIQIYLMQQQRDRLPLIHRQLLDAYHEHSARVPVWSKLYGFLRRLFHLRQLPRDWDDIPPDEQYLWDHLAYHLGEAKRDEELVATIKNWRYLVKKIYLRKSLGVEADLQIAIDTAFDVESLRRLKRALDNTSRLFDDATEDEIESRLYARLWHLRDCLAIPKILAGKLKASYIAVRFDFPELLPSMGDYSIKGELNKVTCCSFNRNRSRIVSGSSHGTLAVWDTLSGELLLGPLKGHSEHMNACAFSPDGNRIVSASSDRTLIIWDFESGEILHQLEGHDAAVNGCVFSSNGSRIFSASSDRALIIWDAWNGTIMQRLEMKEPDRSDDDETAVNGAVNDYAFDADGKRIVSAIVSELDNGNLEVWNVESGQPVRPLVGHSSAVMCCAFSQDGRYLASGSQDGNLRIWDTQKWTAFRLPPRESEIESAGNSGLYMEERPWEGWHEKEVNGCAFSSDGQLIVSASSDGTFKVWEVTSGKCIATFYDEGEMYCCLMHGELIFGGGTRGVYFLELIGQNLSQGQTQ